MNEIKGLFATVLYLGAVIFDENALIPVGTIIVIGGGIWWLGRKLQSLEDGQKNLTKEQERLNKRLDKICENL